MEVSAYTLTGSDGADDVIEVQSEIGFVLEGASGADTLIGGSGDDTLIGGGGDDVFVVDGGEDVIDGGVGRDALDFSASVAGVQVDLSTGTLVDGEGFGDQFSSNRSLLMTLSHAVTKSCTNFALASSAP